ncbi:MAG: hypothetical protein ABIQ93_13100, partial [Saprospiraceae bacterium]
NMWGEERVSDEIFAHGGTAAANNSFQVLELTALDENEPPCIPAGESMVLSPRAAPAGLRSLEIVVDETIIPYGYDEASGLFFPLGYTDANGNVHISVLPPPSSGIIQGDGALTRSLGKSVKLYFKKIFHRKHPELLNALRLYSLPKDGGAWKDLGDNPQKMAAQLSTRPQGRAILLTHGITGDTRHMVAALQEIAEISGVADFVLTYDYENLSTDVSATGKALHEALTAAGFGGANMPELVIVAHSMGGLVSRFLIEVHGGDQYVKKLIQVGVPNAGSELSELATSIFSMLTHALNVTGPVKWVITGLSFLLRKLELDPGQALKDLHPGSVPLIKLAGSRAPKGIPYHGIGGNTELLKGGYDGDNKFLKKVMRALKENVVYPSFTVKIFGDKNNDMAVSMESMRSIAGFESEGGMEVREVASDHLAYFREFRCQQELLGLIKGEELA